MSAKCQRCGVHPPEPKDDPRGPPRTLCRDCRCGRRRPPPDVKGLLAAIARRLHEAAPERGDHARIAYLAGLQQPALSRLRRGTHEPRIGAMVALADALGVSLDWLCGRTDVRERAAG